MLQVNNLPEYTWRKNFKKIQEKKVEDENEMGRD